LVYLLIIVFAALLSNHFISRFLSEQEKGDLKIIFKSVINQQRPPLKHEIVAYIKNHSKEHLVYGEIKRNGSFILSVFFGCINFDLKP
jgi:hypothetical protein